VAFELARKRNRFKRVTSITKSNAQGYGMVLWDRTFAAVARQYPDIETESLLVDAAAMNFVRRPETFDVVVASNPERRYPSMFEPVHGSAPDIAGKGLVNPLATILSGAMMLDQLGQAGAARVVERAVAAVLAEGRIRTPDLGGSSRTSEVTEAVLQKIA
jgi:tartrate dehydrogenase/decarboxylase/D-malate dehydrogenase